MELVTAKQAREETENAVNINEYMEEIMKIIKTSSKEGKLSAVARIHNIRENYVLKKIIQEKMKEYGFKIDLKADDTDIVLAISW